MISLLIIAAILVLIFLILIIVNTKQEERAFIFGLAFMLSLSSICLGGAIENIRLTTLKENNVKISNKDITTNRDIIVKCSKDTLVIIQK